MISWIREHKWLPTALLALFSFLVFGGVDLLGQGLSGLAVAAVYALVIFFSRDFAWLSSAFVVLGGVLEVLLNMKPAFSGIAVAIAVFIAAAFANRLGRAILLAVAIFSGVYLVVHNVLLSSNNLRVYGVVLTSESGQVNATVIGIFFLVLANLVAWIIGRLLITRLVHVGTEFDRVVAERTQAKLNLEVAEQNERFGIARDISELIIQRVSATISLAEGGTYATKADPTAAVRVLERVTQSARDAHTELRRLFDMLNKTHRVSAAPPRIDDLEKLIIVFREMGYNINLRHDGPRFEVDEGAELAIYRIVYDALDNVKQHTPIGTDVTVDFSWTNEGAQILVKDNGVEVSNRGLTLEQLTYTAEQDLQSLLEDVVGAGITAMSERAALYGGSVEANRVQGVGFTVSAIFPNLRQLAGARK